ncbi:MAG: hypothetical protein ACJAT1_002053 [Marivirga sp.]|jgi:hypothetical protein
MKKSIIITGILVAIAAFTVNAQIFTIGPKLGISSTNIKPSESATNFLSGDSKVSYHAGLFARIKIASFYIQPELYFNSVNAVYKDNTGAEYEFDKSKVDLPIMLGWKIGPLRLNAGPVASFSTNTDLDPDLDTAVDEYKGAIFAYQAGIGLDISKLTIDVRYEGNLSNQGTFTGGDGGFKVNQILFSVGFKLI